MFWPKPSAISMPVCRDLHPLALRWKPNHWIWNAPPHSCFLDPCWGHYCWQLAGCVPCNIPAACMWGVKKQILVNWFALVPWEPFSSSGNEQAVSQDFPWALLALGVGCRQLTYGGCGCQPGWSPAGVVMAYLEAHSTPHHTPFPWPWPPGSLTGNILFVTHYNQTHFLEIKDYLGLVV